jgi:hypothetical protein
MDMIQNMINSIISSTGTVIQNSNTPSTDSGYVSPNANEFLLNNTIVSDNPSSFLNFGFYSIMVLLALILILSGINKRKVSSKFI